MNFKKTVSFLVIVTFFLLAFIPEIEANVSKQRVYINEFMASNGETLTDEYGNYGDWIELYNPGEEEIDLAGYFVSDSADEPYKWELPTGYEETVIVGKGFLLLWADGEEELGPLHLGFKLSREGESLFITSPEGEIVDRVSFTLQQRDVSYGRDPENPTRWLYFNEPTPGKDNYTSGIRSLNLVGFYSFYRDNREIVWLSGGFIIILLTIVYLLFRINLKYKHSKQQLIASNLEVKKMVSEYEKIINNNNDALFLINVENGEFKYYRFNPAHERLTGFISCEANNKTPSQLLGPKQGKIMEENYRKCYEQKQPISYEIELELPTGRKTLHTNLAPVIVEDQVTQLVGSTRDISARKEMEERIRELSYRDSVTGLYNRHYFNEELYRYDTRRQLPLSIIVGDVNGLKLTNDAFGHLKGDELLQKVGAAIKESCRHEDLVARWGGDEFVILLPQTDLQTTSEISERIKERVGKVKGDLLTPSISIGFAAKCSEEQKIERIFKEAEDMMYRNKIIESKVSQDTLLNALKNRLREKSLETAVHCRRVKELSVRLGEALGIRGQELENLSLIAELHDFGKVAISREILCKPGILSEEEWNEVKKHSVIGFQIARSTTELANLADGFLFHHEWWDGSGYPQGLKGEGIPLFSRIISIADAYDVMTHERPYKRTMSKQEALQELRENAGSQFDPVLVEVFIEKAIND